jgi:acyl carrier protein
MHDTAVLERVSYVIRNVLRRPDLHITPRTRAPDVPGWDSFAMIAIIIEVQDAFEVELTTDSLDEMHNVGDLVRAIIAGRPSMSN